MKIGIITFHCAHNYGALLQCFALQEHLKTLGHDVAVVDYRPECITSVYSCDLWDELRMLGLFSSLRRFIFRRRPEKVEAALRRWLRYKMLNKWSKDYLNTAQPSATGYDVLVYGSDQIWNGAITEADDMYWGHHEIRAQKHITYSASAGDTGELDKWGTEFVRQALKKFSALSVRESDQGQWLQAHTETPVHCTVDPVFLLGAEGWSRLCGEPVRQEKYILVYNLLQEEHITRMAEDLSQKTGYKVIELRVWVLEDDALHPERCTHASPSDFVGLFRDAAYVLSSSFHGVAFSVLFNKPFYAYLPKVRSRVCSLLESLGMEERYIDHIPDNWADVPDYTEANRRMKAWVEQSKAYLSENI